MSWFKKKEPEPDYWDVVSAHNHLMNGIYDLVKENLTERMRVCVRNEAVKAFKAGIPPEANPHTGTEFASVWLNAYIAEKQKPSDPYAKKN